jgi:hypothetical protein
MKLLLDVHHSPRAAERLREQGRDVIAAAADPHLSPLADSELLRFARSDGRTLVTENVKDFARIVHAWAAAGEHHAGILFTSPRRLHRGSLAYPENLVVALERFLGDPVPAGQDWLHWLG